MTISEKLVLLQQDITNARTKITEKGGTVTASGGSSQLATDIATIPTGITPSGNIALTATTSTQTGINVTNYATASVAPTPSESKTLTLSSTSPSTVYPTSGKYLSSVVVSKDTSVIKADNIAKGKTLLGVTGTYTGAYIYITSSQKLATITCGSQSYTLTGDEVSHAFAVTNGTYNCKSTLGSFSSSTTTVSVSSNTVYPVELTIKRVPSDYQEVEYIQAYGNQYINTLTAPFDGIYCRCRLYLNVIGIARAYFGTGGDDSWGTYEGSYNIWDNYNSDNNTGVGVNFIGSVDITKNGPATNVTYTIGTSTYSASITHGTTYPSDSRPIYVLWKNGTTRPKLTGRLVGFQLGRSDTDLIRDFIPCYRKSDNVVGVYDTISQTFFENAGTGAFTAGPNVN